MAPIPSSPATFTVVSGTPQVCTFPIPAGLYSDAVWEEAGTKTNTSVDTVVCPTITGATVSFPSHVGGAYDQTVEANASQLAGINEAAGGTLTVQFETTDSSNAVSAFTLTLTPANSGGGTGRSVNPVQISTEQPTATLTVPVPITIPENVPGGVLYDDAFRNIQNALASANVQISTINIFPPALDNSFRILSTVGKEPTAGSTCLALCPNNCYVAVWEGIDITGSNPAFSIQAMASSDGGRTWLALEGGSALPSVVYSVGAGAGIGIPADTCPMIGVDSQNNLYIFYVTQGNNGGVPCGSVSPYGYPSTLGMAIYTYQSGAVWTKSQIVASIEMPFLQPFSGGCPNCPYCVSPPSNPHYGAQFNQNLLRGDTLFTQGFVVAAYAGYGASSHIGSISCYPAPTVSGSVSPPAGQKGSTSEYANAPYLVQVYDFNAASGLFRGALAQKLLNMQDGKVMALFELQAQSTSTGNTVAIAVTSDVVNWPASLVTALPAGAAIAGFGGNLRPRMWDACVIGTGLVGLVWVDNGTQGLSKGVFYVTITESGTPSAPIPLGTYSNEVSPIIQATDNVIRVLWIHDRDITGSSNITSLSFNYRSCPVTSDSTNLIHWTSTKDFVVWGEANNVNDVQIAQVSGSAQGVDSSIGVNAWPILFSRYDNTNDIGELGFKSLVTAALDN